MSDKRFETPTILQTRLAPDVEKIVALAEGGQDFTTNLREMMLPLLREGIPFFAINQALDEVINDFNDDFDFGLSITEQALQILIAWQETPEGKAQLIKDIGQRLQTLFGELLLRESDLSEMHETLKSSLIHLFEYGPKFAQAEELLEAARDTILRQLNGVDFDELTVQFNKIWEVVLSVWQAWYQEQGQDSEMVALEAQKLAPILAVLRSQFADNHQLPVAEATPLFTQVIEAALKQLKSN